MYEHVYVFFKEIQNVPRPSTEHPPVGGKNVKNVFVVSTSVIT